MFQGLRRVLGRTSKLAATNGVGTTRGEPQPMPMSDDQRRASVAARQDRCNSNLVGSLAGSLLLVEDQVHNATVAAELLTLMGMTVTCASDGEQAVRLAFEQSFDVVLMDCRMPKVDGYEATRRIRASEDRTSPSRVPIIAVTADALPGVWRNCLAAGMDDYLAKPYTATQLQAKLAAWLLADATAAPAIVVRSTEDSLSAEAIDQRKKQGHDDSC